MIGPRFLSSCFLVLSLLLPVAARTQQPTVAERYLFEAANQERRAAGLKPLSWNPRLVVAAHPHAEEMARRHAISHQFSDEGELSDRAASATVRFSEVAENVGVAPSPAEMHEAWMQSPGHRANILDPKLTSLGVSVVYRNGYLWAVQDFARDVVDLSFNAQEQQVSRLLGSTGMLQNISVSDAARQSCTMNTGYAGPRRPWFVMRYTASDLSRLPEQLATRLRSGKYRQAAVGACDAKVSKFSSYNIAVLLYP